MRDTVGLLIRLIAWLYDLLLVGVPVAVMGVTLFGMKIAALCFLIGVFLLYAAVIPVMTSGFSVGKWLVGIRIVSLEGDLTWRAMMIRHVLSFIVYVLTGGVLFLLSAFMVMIRLDHRSLHDQFAKTAVVIEKGKD